MVISISYLKKKLLLLKTDLGKNKRKFTSKNIVQTIKEVSFNSKLRNGNPEELSNIFKSRLGQLHESESIMMLYGNPFSTPDLNFVAKDISAVYEANVARPEI
jgi:hypothetical protein